MLERRKSESGKGVGNSGEGKTYHKPPPEEGFWIPPTYDSETGRIRFRRARFQTPNSVSLLLGCRKWGFKRWGFKQIRVYLRKKAFFLRFLDFPGALRTLRKRAKKGDFGRFRQISRKGGQTPLKPPFVTPPFAAAQFLALTELCGENSVSSSQPIICVPKRTHQVFRIPHRVCRKTQ